jgi:sec-independent protein translocase protein TatB
MLPDLSPVHILIVIVVALIVVGPKDLPMLLRKIGQFMGRMRGMANEFRASFDEMARQSELDELRKEVEAMRAATQASLPQDFGGAAAASDAESAYLANWQASHAEPTDSFLPGMPDSNSIMPPTTVELGAAAKAQAASKKAAAKSKAQTKTAAKAEAKAAPKAAAKPSKTADAVQAAPKPRAKKAKNAGDAA